ncbi:MAG: DUF3368 domain-containing protein [Candidatus Solibacter sp.]
MLVVSNTSPICNLAIIGRLHLLQDQLGEIRIPAAVQRELDQLSHADGSKAVQLAITQGRIQPVALQDDKIARLLQTALHPGEAEAIALALNLPADLILLDERDGRMTAERGGLRVTGVLGVLLKAKKDGQIQAVKPELEALRTGARFFGSAQLERKILDLAGE